MTITADPALDELVDAINDAFTNPAEPCSYFRDDGPKCEEQATHWMKWFCAVGCEENGKKYCLCLPHYDVVMQFFRNGEGAIFCTVCQTSIQKYEGGAL